jgi:hypothetical protein
MRTLVIALVSWLLAAPAAAPPPRERILGVWDGTLTTAPAGNCTMHGGPHTVRLVVMRGPDGKVRAGLTQLPAMADQDDNLKVSLSDKKVRFEQSGVATCGQNHSKYKIKYEGAWPIEADGTRTLRLEGMDSPCPFGGCHFRKVLDLQWKREPPEYK